MFIAAQPQRSLSLQRSEMFIAAQRHAITLRSVRSETFQLVVAHLRCATLSNDYKHLAPLGRPPSVAVCGSRNTLQS